MPNLNELKASLASLRQDNAVLAREQKELDGRICGLNQEIESTSRNEQQARNSITVVQAELRQRQTKLVTLNHSADASKTKIDTLVAQLADYLAKMEKTKNKNEFQKLEKKFKEITIELDKEKIRNAQIKIEINQMSAGNTAAINKMANAANEVLTFQQQKEALVAEKCRHVTAQQEVIRQMEYNNEQICQLEVQMLAVRDEKSDSKSVSFSAVGSQAFFQQKPKRRNVEAEAAAELTQDKLLSYQEPDLDISCPKIALRAMSEEGLRKALLQRKECTKSILEAAQAAENKKKALFTEHAELVSEHTKNKHKFDALSRKDKNGQKGTDLINKNNKIDKQAKKVKSELTMTSIRVGVYAKKIRDMKAENLQLDKDIRREGQRRTIERRDASAENTFDYIISTAKNLIDYTRFNKLKALIHCGELLLKVFGSDVIGEKQKSACDIFIQIGEELIGVKIPTDKKLIIDKVKFIYNELKQALVDNNEHTAAAPTPR